MSLTVIDLTHDEATAGLGWCVSCDKHPATTLVLDDCTSLILGNADVGAEFGVCGMCAEVAFPNFPRAAPRPRVPTHDGS